MAKEKRENESPNTIKGYKRRRYGIPEARKARISLSEESLPIAIRPPTNEAKGKVKDTIAGSE